MSATARHALFACVYVALLAGEGVWLFAEDNVRVSVVGGKPFVIDTFGVGARVEHGFLMDGDGLVGVSVRFSADQPMSIRVVTVLSEADPDVPEVRAELYRWVSPVTLERGLAWRRFSFPEVARSDGRFYAFSIRLVDGVISGDDAGARREKLPVALMASHDNPPRGGKLWIDGVRQGGSLNLRAHGPDETAYQRFRRSIEPRLPWILRYRALQVAIVLGYQWALFAFADALLFGGIASTRPQT